MSGTDSDSSVVFVGESHKVQIHTLPNQMEIITTIPETQEQTTVPETPNTKKKILNFSPGKSTVPETQGKSNHKYSLIHVKNFKTSYRNLFWLKKLQNLQEMQKLFPTRNLQKTTICR